MEASYIFKEFFDRTLNSNNYESRTSNYYVDKSKRENYLFNSTINGIEDSDLIFLIGSNPRFEATILNARIRKSFVSNNTKIISLNDVGDLTYPYKHLDGQTKTLVEIFEGQNDISREIMNSKKPLIILGESFFKTESANFMFNLVKKYLKDNDKISNEWNPINSLSCDAATVGSLDLNIINDKNNLFDELNNHQFDVVYLLGQDSLSFIKKNEFIIYQGSHGDKGAEMADIILPGATYTEQNGYFTNLEGKLQKAYKASYPPGEAKEDWQIINELAEFMNNRKLFNDKDELDSSMFNYINLKKENTNLQDHNTQTKENFTNENLKINYKDYYFSNVIARASKTMLDCHNSKVSIKLTGTNG
jgi:NADH-quinone oxidoreductase subunit G